MFLRCSLRRYAAGDKVLSLSQEQNVFIGCLGVEHEGLSSPNFRASKPPTCHGRKYVALRLFPRPATRVFCVLCI